MAASPTILSDNNTWTGTNTYMEQTIFNGPVIFNNTVVFNNAVNFSNLSTPTCDSVFVFNLGVHVAEGDLVITLGNLIVDTGTLDVEGDVIFRNQLDVVGAAQFRDEIDITGAATFHSTSRLVGEVTIVAPATFEGNVTVLPEGHLKVRGITQCLLGLEVFSDASFLKDITIGGNLITNGNGGE